jgi:hypothetical protein
MKEKIELRGSEFLFWVISSFLVGFGLGMGIINIVLYFLIYHQTLPIF